MPKELTIYTGTIHKFAIISNHDQRSIERSIDQSSALGMARCDNAPGKNRQVPGAAAAAAVCTVHTGLGSPRDWQAKMRRCLLEIDWQQHGQLWLCLVLFVVRCCCCCWLLLSSISVVMSNAFITRRNA